MTFEALARLVASFDPDTARAVELLAGHIDPTREEPSLGDCILMNAIDHLTGQPIADAARHAWRVEWDRLLPDFIDMDFIDDDLRD